VERICSRYEEEQEDDEEEEEENNNNNNNNNNNTYSSLVGSQKPRDYLKDKYVDGRIIIIIQFNSVLYYLCAESAATGPITDPAQYRYT
jgi:hypothetical protein